VLSAVNSLDTLNVAADNFTRSTLFEVTAISSVVFGTARNILLDAWVGIFSATAKALDDSLAVACARQGRLATSRTIAAIGRFENV